MVLTQLGAGGDLPPVARRARAQPRIVFTGDLVRFRAKEEVQNLKVGNHFERF